MKVTTSKLEQELRTATKVKGNSADRQESLAALLGAVHDLKDDEWEGLSKSAQDWANSATKAEKDGKQLPDFTDLVDEEEEKVEKAKTAKKKAATKAAKPAVKEPTIKLLKTDGVKYRIKKAILGKPSITADELAERLGKGGDKISKVTIAGIRAEFRHSLRVLLQEDALKQKLEL